MKLLKLHRILFFNLLVLMLSSCVDEIDFNTENLESALVIEATITNELRQQEVLLSRTYAFESEVPAHESNAIVTIDSNLGSVMFNEVSPGRYVSDSQFRAQPNIAYVLRIQTIDGKLYQSNEVQLTPEIEIDRLTAVRETLTNSGEGMSIYLDSFDTTEDGNYFRYEYEETFKIIAPKWSSLDLVVVEEPQFDCEVALEVKQQEERVCFRTENSNTINVLNISGLSENSVLRHRVRYINRDDYRISHRYSILVKQYVQSLEAYTYYQTLNDFSESESVFSSNQPGFFAGNISSVNNSEEKVVGFFDVSSVNTKRLFFNYEDFFPNEGLPPYINRCFEFAPRQFSQAPGVCGSLLNEITRNDVKYVSLNLNPNPAIPGPYLVVVRECGDCTALGENVPPSFWVE
ncbi:MAG: DUF4249 domain-containing protein [Bacteroidetes bacterium]|nr:DUF4249 domain-containing protein [Bacteroidota bacterium]